MNNQDFDTEKLMNNINKKHANEMLRGQVKPIDYNRGRISTNQKNNIRNFESNNKKVKEVKEISGKKVLFYMALATTILTAAFVSKKISDKKALNHDHSVTDYSTGSTTYYDDYKPGR